MKIKTNGFTSVRMAFKKITVVTDPTCAKEITGGFSKTQADVILYSKKDLVGKEEILEKAGLTSKIEVSEGRSLIEISNPGEYEAGGVFIRRAVNQNVFILDESDIRIVYIGEDSKSIPMDALKNLGDVDILIVPAGGSDVSDRYMGDEKLEKVIKAVDPTVLVPTGFAAEGVKMEGLKTAEEFIKHFGYTNVSEEKTFKMVKGKETDNKIMRVILLQA